MSITNNVKWVALSKAIQIFLQLMSLTVLTRLLAPEQYGLMAMAAVVTNFVVIIRDLGTAAAIIQKRDLTQATTSTIFWLNLMMGFLICIFVIIISPLVAKVFHAQALIPVLALTAISFPIASCSAIHLALLERNSQFKSIANLEMTAAVFGLLVAIIMAYSGFGVYSLVGQTLCNCTISSSLLWRSSSWRPCLVFYRGELKGLLGFSGNLTVFNLINYFSRNADSMIIGNNFSATILGAYSLAYRIMLFPVQSLTFVVTRSLYPVLSQNQQDASSVKDIYLKVIVVIASVTAPMMSGMVVLRKPFVELILGNQWTLVPALLLWLAPTGLIQSLVSTTGSVFMANGKTYLLMKLGFFSAILQVCAFIIGARYNVQLVALLYFFANLINSFFAFYFTIRLINGSLSEFLQSISPPLVCTFFMVICMTLSERLLITDNWLIVIVKIMFGMAVYAIAYRCFFPVTFKKIIPISLQRFAMY